MARTRATTQEDQRTAVLRARVETHVAEAVESLVAQNPDVDSTSEMVRLLIRKGLHAVHTENQQRAIPDLSTVRQEYAQKVEWIMTMLSDVIAEIERTDAEGALLLARGIVKSSDYYSKDLARRHNS